MVRNFSRALLLGSPAFYCVISSLLGVPLLASAEAEHHFDFSSRSRYAEVASDEDGKDISTLLRLNLRSTWNEQVHSTIETDVVHSFLPDEHSDGVRIIDNKALIPDARGFDLNQAFVSFVQDAWKLDAGRQRINLDSQRFIGGNGYWQNEQTFDAIRSQYALASNSSLTYAYIRNVNRIFGPKAKENASISYDTLAQLPRPAELYGVHHHQTHLARFEWNEWDYSQWVVYGYFIDNKSLPITSNNTFGTSYSLNYKSDLFKYRLQLETAVQDRTDIKSAPQLPYYLFDAGIGLRTLEFSTRYEVMSAKDTIAFITPLGSNADFTGWANKFGSSAITGVKDASLRLLWRASPFRVDARYHVFNAYDGDQALGTEADIEIVYKPQRKHAFAIRFADFSPAASSTEKNHTKKFYLDYTYNL